MLLSPRDWGKFFLLSSWKGLLVRTHGSCLSASISPGAVLQTGITKSLGTCVPWKWQRSGTPFPPCRQLALRQNCELQPRSRVTPPSLHGTKGVRGESEHSSPQCCLQGQSYSPHPAACPHLLKFLSTYMGRRISVSHLHTTSTSIPESVFCPLEREDPRRPLLPSRPGSHQSN